MRWQEVALGKTGVKVVGETKRLVPVSVLRLEKPPGAHVGVRLHLRRRGDAALFRVGADKLEELASIKSKNELIADVVALLQSPAKNVLSALQSGAGTIHGVLKTLGERAE